VGVSQFGEWWAIRKAWAVSGEVNAVPANGRKGKKVLSQASVQVSAYVLVSGEFKAKAARGNRSVHSHRQRM